MLKAAGVSLLREGHIAQVQYANRLTTLHQVQIIVRASGRT